MRIVAFKNATISHAIFHAKFMRVSEHGNRHRKGHARSQQHNLRVKNGDELDDCKKQNDAATKD